jgi:hypothetical protein
MKFIFIKRNTKSKKKKNIVAHSSNYRTNHIINGKAGRSSFVISTKLSSSHITSGDTKYICSVPFNKAYHQLGKV